VRSGLNKEAVMAEDTEPVTGEDTEPDKGTDPDAGAKKALEAERKARREAEKALRDMQSRLKEIEDKDKSETDKLREQVEQLKSEASTNAAKALRAEIAAERGLTPAQAKRLVGSTREELEADADEILEAFPAGAKAPPSDKPRAELRGGTDPTEDPSVDIREVVGSIPRGF